MGESEQEYSSGDSEACGPYIRLWLRGNAFHTAMQVSLTYTDLFLNGRTKRCRQTKVSGHSRGEGYQSLILPHRGGKKTSGDSLQRVHLSRHFCTFQFPSFSIHTHTNTQIRGSALKQLLSSDLFIHSFWNITYSITHQPGHKRIATHFLIGFCQNTEKIYLRARNLTFKCIREVFTWILN